MTFVSHKNKKKSAKQTDGKGGDLMDIVEPADGSSGGAISLKEARFEVFKFGLQALSKKDRMEAKAALAIKLGAIPSKKQPFLPYAELKAVLRICIHFIPIQIRNFVLHTNPDNSDPIQIYGKS